MSLKFFGLFVLFFVAGVHGQTPAEFQSQFDQLMSRLNQSLFNAYNVVTAPLGTTRQTLISQVDAIPAVLNSFTALANLYSTLWSPVRSTYDEAINSAKTIIETNANHTDIVINIAFDSADSRARTNLTLAFNVFYNQSNYVFQILYAGLSNPLTFSKTIKCIQLHWAKIEAAGKALNLTIPNCVAKAKFNFAPVSSFITQANSILNSKYAKFAACTSGINDMSTEAAIAKALNCIVYESTLIPYTASQVSVAILNAGISTQDIITAQEIKIYSCLKPIFSKVGSQMTSLTNSLTSCMA
jgi:hypothetical protein